MRAIVLTLAAIVLVLSTGCATTQEPIVRTETREVRVPVLVRCVKPEDIPAPPKTAMDPKGDTKQLAAGAAADVLELEAYSEKLRARLLECAR